MKLSDYYPQLEGWTPVEPGEVPKPPIPDATTQVNPYLRTTMPLSLQYQPDTLRQFNRPGLSSYRVAPLPPNALPTMNSVAQGVAQNVVNETPITTSELPLSLSQSFISTASLAAGATQVGTVQMAPVLTLVFVTVNVAARVRLYSTQSARDADINRPNSIPPTPGLANYLISDHYLTNAPNIPLNFPCSPCPIGANQDASPSASIYWCVTNIGTTSQAIVVTLKWLEMEQT